ncbi:MAG: hypothetical protein ACRD1Q_10885 [Vicinamibacterales bacterium]
MLQKLARRLAPDLAAAQVEDVPHSIHIALVRDRPLTLEPVSDRG